MAHGAGCDPLMNTGRKSLNDILVVMGVTGSIGAVECVKLAHALRRRGAEVQGVMSNAATGIIHPDTITYATGRPALTKITGMIEHVMYCGEGGSADVLLIAPCTANTLCKIAAGIDDTPVTTFATTAIGRGIPVILVPAMHHSMYRHPAVADAINRLKSWGILFAGPRIEENKAKVADLDEIVLHVERAVQGMPLSGRKVLITSGPCQEPIDDVRVMTTRSSGNMGREIALEAFRLGADVTVVHDGTIPCVENVQISSAAEMGDAVHRLLKERDYDFYVSAAAISDFAPKRIEGKIPSGAALNIQLEPLPKLINEVASRYHPTIVAFKLGWEEEEKAGAMLEAGIAMVVVNSPDAMGKDEGLFTLMKTDEKIEIRGTKEEVAAAIWSVLL